MAIFTSYDVKGNKLSFANWISNLSPTDTFFVSVTGKEMIKNKKFQWQTDSLVKATLNNAHLETDDLVAGNIADRTSTEEHFNITQIFRKAVHVTDTADALDNYGRKQEMAYQLEKAGKELKRDLEMILLSSQLQTTAGADDKTKARKTGCFVSLVAQQDAVDTDTGAIVHQKSADKIPTEEELFLLTYNLFLSGSSANHIMYHPMHATFFSSLMETAPGAGTRTKMIDNMETKLNKFVGTLVDPLGQEWKLVPNRFMPKNMIYFFNPKDWTQMVLRAPEKTKLAKTGSSERYMIEMELGLRHRNPFASGVLELKDQAPYA